jgi:hypothetical protein
VIYTLSTGKLHVFEARWWLIFQTQEAITLASCEFLRNTRGSLVNGEYIDGVGRHYQSKTGIPTTYAAPKSLFMLLEQQSKYCKILTENGVVGWIKLDDGHGGAISLAHGQV